MASLSLTCLACGEEIDVEWFLTDFDGDEIVCPSCDGRASDLVGAAPAGHEAA